MAIVRIFEVISNEFRAMKICTVRIVLRNGPLFLIYSSYCLHYIEWRGACAVSSSHNLGYRLQRVQKILVQCSCNESALCERSVNRIWWSVVTLCTSTMEHVLTLNCLLEEWGFLSCFQRSCEFVSSNLQPRQGTENQIPFHLIWIKGLLRKLSRHFMLWCVGCHPQDLFYQHASLNETDT